MTISIIVKYFDQYIWSVVVKYTNYSQDIIPKGRKIGIEMKIMGEAGYSRIFLYNLDNLTSLL